MKSRAWFYRFPSMVYAAGPLRFEKLVDEQEVRCYVRGLHTIRGLPIKRLPYGFECWPTK